MNEGIKHAAITVSGQPFHAPGFNHTAHDRWVAKGYCPVVQSTKAWCVKPAGHYVGKNNPWSFHKSIQVVSDGKTGDGSWHFP